MNLPEQKSTQNEYDRLTGSSEMVLFRLKGLSRISQGVYFTRLDLWQIEGVHGEFKSDEIAEWWPMPKEGTGYLLTGERMEPPAPPAPPETRNINEDKRPKKR